MTYCTRCGQLLIRKWMDGDTRERYVCGSCHEVHYENPKVLVWCVAYWREQILLCRRANEPGRGLWNPPAGFVEIGETLEEAACRELREETGLNLRPSCMVLYRVLSIPHMNQIYIGFRAELSAEPALRLGPEVLDARMYSEADVPLREFAFREMLTDVPEGFFRSLRSGEFMVFSETAKPVQSVGTPKRK